MQVGLIDPASRRVPADPLPHSTSAGRERPADRDQGGADVWEFGGPDRPHTPWPWWYGPVGLAGGLVAAIALAVVVFGFLGLPPGEPYTELLVVGSLAGVAALLARRRGPVRPRLFGLRTTPARAAVGWVVLTYVLQILVTALWISVVHSHYSNVPRGVSGDLPGGVLGLIVAVAVIAPIGEEIVFRGFLYGALRNRLGTFTAATVAGVVFGCAHFTSAAASWQIVPPLAFFGIAQCLLYERTGSILPCIAAHMLLNGIAIGLATGTLGTIALVLLGAAACFLMAPWRLARRQRRRGRSAMSGRAAATG